MNKEEMIERFRSEKLQEYIELAENEPYTVKENPKKDNSGIISCRICKVCKKVKPIIEFYGKYKTVCKECKIKYQMQRYYSKKVEYYKEKLENVC